MSFRNLFFAAFLFGIGGTAYAVNPELTYFSKGDTPDPWHWVVQDPGNWWLKVDGNQGASAAGKVTLEASDAPEFPGAVKATWDKAAVPEKQGNWGGLSITGRSVDLSAFEHTGQLMLALRVDMKPKKDVKVKMLCGDGCKAGEVSILTYLKKAKLQEWFALPIPLDCFAGVDLKKVGTPVEIGTDGRMVLHIAEVSIQKMAPGDEGCVPNNPAAPQGDAGTK